MNLSIGDLARRTAVKVPTIRYYEEIGLLPAAPRSAGGQRRYDGDAVDRLGFIRHARHLGFEIEAIRELLDLSVRPAAPCREADAIAARQLEAVELRIGQLNALRSELRKMLGDCDGGRIADCRVLESLNAPAPRARS